MSDKIREQEIKERARKVYEISFDYHLTHAVFGTDSFLHLDLRKTYKGKFSRLKEAMKKAAKDRDATLIKTLTSEEKKLDDELESKRQHILVDYIKMDDVEGGRVIKAEKKLIISLPRKLTENMLDANGKLQKDAVAVIRKKMAHELGHIVLHTDQLPMDKTGSKGLDDREVLDWEANVFAEELLHLYEIRDHHID